MSYKTILVHVDGPERNGGAVTLAASIAARFEAHLIGMAVIGDFQERFFGDGFSANAAILDEALHMLQQQARNRLAGFEVYARAAGVNSVEQCLVEDNPAMAICHRAACSDLVIVEQSHPERFARMLGDDVALQVLQYCGRPVIVVPWTGSFPHTGARVVVGWDASVQAARAVSCALPLLQRAERVQLLSIHSDKNRSSGDPGTGLEVARYLGRHGVEVELVQRLVTSADHIADALLSAGTDFGADLIVMGGFAHSRVREMLWGGVTRSILAEMTVPVLLAH